MELASLRPKSALFDICKFGSTFESPYPIGVQLWSPASESKFTVESNYNTEPKL